MQLMINTPEGAYYLGICMEGYGHFCMYGKTDWEQLLKITSQYK